LAGAGGCDTLLVLICDLFETPRLNVNATSQPDPGPLPDAAEPDDEPPSGPGEPAAAAVTLSLETDDADPPLAGWVEPRLARAAALADAPDASLSLVVVDDPAMTTLHREHLGLDATTDVLTFDLRDEPAEPIDGEIVVCLDEARRQARSRGHPARVEVLLYAIHGLLHLLGEDDHDDDGYQRMHAREDELLEALGIGAVFGRAGDEPEAQP